MSFFLLSVIIPTRNRNKYAFYAVKQILDNCDRNIQVVLQNNSDSNELMEMLKEYRNDRRLKYNYVANRLSGVDNFDMALGLADGEYIVVIGDDDGINPQIIDCVKWMKKENVDIVKPAISLGYNWPIIKSDNTELLKSSLVRIDRVSGKRKILNTFEGVKKLMRNGGQDYLHFEIAKSYHGIVKRECMQRVNEMTGKYFGGLSPDIYSAVALSLIENLKIVEIDYPFTISGVCRESTSAASVNNKHVGKLSEAPHFIGIENYTWETEVPEIYSVQTIWAETAIKSIRKCGREDIVSNYFSQEKLIFNIISNNTSIRGDLFKIIDKRYSSLFYSIRRNIFSLILKWRKLQKRAIKYFKRKFKYDYVIYNIMNIDEASAIISQVLKSPSMIKSFERALSDMKDD